MFVGMAEEPDWWDVLCTIAGFKLSQDQIDAIKQSTNVQADIRGLLVQSAIQTAVMIKLTRWLIGLTIALIVVGILQIALIGIQILLLLK